MKDMSRISKPQITVILECQVKKFDFYFDDDRTEYAVCDMIKFIFEKDYGYQ